MIYDEMPDRPPERPTSAPAKRSVRPDYDYQPTFYTPNLPPASPMVDYLLPPAAQVWKGSDVLWMTIISVVIFFPLLIGLIVIVAGPTTDSAYYENIIYTDPLISFSILLLEPVSLFAAMYLLGLKRRGYNWKALGFFRTRSIWIIGACALGVVFLPINGMINLTVELYANPEYGRQLLEAAGLDSDNPFDFPDDNQFGSNSLLQTLSSFDTYQTPFFFSTQTLRPSVTPQRSTQSALSTTVASSGFGSTPLPTADQFRPSRTPVPFPSPTAFPSNRGSNTNPTTTFGQTELLNSAADTPLGILGTLLLAGLAVPIAEEMFFRGVLFAWLRSKWGIWVGVIVSSFVFGLLHGSAGMVAATFVLGAIAAIMYEKSGSLWPAIAIHATNNLLVLLIRYLLVP